MTDQPPTTETPPTPPPAGDSGLSKNATQWATICHLAAFSGFIVAGVGWILGPLVVWLIKKDEDPFIDEQGKEAVNFQITVMLALLCCIPFVLIFIGILMAIAVMVCSIIFTVIAAVKTSNGEHYRYPVSLRLIK